MECEMKDLERLAEDYRRVEKAIAFLDANQGRQPTLAEVAAHLALSEHHFQRLFSRWAGISPKRFLQFLTKEHASALLDKAHDVLSVAYEVGLSGPGRLHDLIVSCEAVTPGELRARGKGLCIAYGLHPSPFGECLLAVTERGICGLAFVGPSSRDEALDALRGRWEGAQWQEDPNRTAPIVRQVFAQFGGEATRPLHLLVRGTNFQLKVWEALLRIPPGRAVTYRDLAVSIGTPGGARAVGQAVGRNPIAYLIPCHRVIRQVGGFGGYRWGTVRKRAMLGREAALAGDSGERAAC